MKLDRVIALRNRKTIYRDGDRCIKVFNAGYSKADILNEALNQVRMEETGLPIPRILEVTTVDGKWAIATEFIKGKTLAQLMQEKPHDAEKHIEILVDLQLKMHAITCPDLHRLKDKLNSRISRTELDAATRRELLKRLECMPENNKVCHGDFSPSNIIIREGGQPYILDWSHAAQGVPQADAAYTCLLLMMDGETGYAETYLELFCRKSNSDRQSVEAWLPIAAAGQLIKGNAEKREFLLSRINIEE